jgi:hypothetical protein
MKNFYTFIWISSVLYSAPALAFGGEVDSAKGSEGNFTGVITYDVLVESKSPLVSTETLQHMYGTTVHMYIGDGEYKLVFDGDSTIEVIYRGGENRQYVLMGNSDSMLWRTADNYDSKFIATRSTEDAVIVLDRHCDSYSIETDWGAITYFYDPSIKMDPSPYRGHGFNYFNVYLRHSHAPYLKYLYDGPTMKMTLTAKKIEDRPVDPGIFEPLPLPLASLDLPSVCNLKKR